MSKNKTVLVTGCSGFIGSVVTEKLIDKGYNVVGVDNFQSSKPVSILKEINFVEGNFADPVVMKKIFSEQSIDVVFHFAAETTIDFCFTEPGVYFQNNIVNGLVLLDLMREYQCSDIVFSSTAAIFGEPIYTPIDEKHAKVPINAYGESKLMFESILDWYHKAYGINYNAFRYFNAAGASKLNGENRLHETHLLPIILGRSLKGEPIKVFGNDYATKDGSCIRDYVHVEDIADGHLLAIENIGKNPNGKYNLGSGEGYSVFDVIKASEEVSGLKVKYEIVSRREGDPAVLVASNELAKNELGWMPVRSSLDRIVKDTFDWIKKL